MDISVGELDMPTGGGDSAPASSNGWASREDWPHYQTVISQLYAKHTLAEVMEAMERQYGFRAT